jgi:hypothetical protein
MCNGVIFSVWLLLSYQDIYVIAHIICNHSVRLKRYRSILVTDMWNTF